MQHDEEDFAPRPIEGQLAIPVPEAPGAIGRWTTDDEFAAYAREHGMGKAIEQKKLVEDSRNCNCGQQELEDQKAREDERRARKISGHLHKAGCPQKTAFSSTPVRITPEEQERRYGSGRTDEKGWLPTPRSSLADN